MITPADIENKVFTKAVRGYKEDEVDDFLDLIILDMEKLIKENRQLKKELEKTKGQVDRHVSTESSVYETLEAAKSLMNDIAASAERRAQVILKDAELEAALITREARESISRLTDEEARMKNSVERIREKYRQILELELERADMLGSGLFDEFGSDFLPISDKAAGETTVRTERTQGADTKESATAATAKKSEDLSKTMVNIR
ncbi:MAG: DivIVA domain-containing protein [Firmicutes bacterium]|nr:DivIVA domain-containing protein [Bacillota bacterium]